MSSSNDSDNHSLVNSTDISHALSNNTVSELVAIGNYETELAYFLSVNIERVLLEQVIFDAHQNQTSIQDELVANGHLDEEQHFQHIAEMLELPFYDYINPEHIVGSQYIDVLLKRKGPLRLTQGDKITTVISPTVKEAALLKEQLALKPDLGKQMAIASGSTVRKAVWQFGRQERVKDTVRDLPENSPDLSAKLLMTNWQSFALGVFLACFLILAVTSTGTALTILHIFISFLYLSSNLLKLSATTFTHEDKPALSIAPEDTHFPTYTILVALYDEAPVAEQLVLALERLNWPKSKLDIKLVCEEEDINTIRALEAANPGPQFEIIEVPNQSPRTKPKALQYALKGARGDFIAVYDAEDIPNPDQLREAVRTFAAAGDDLACLQAPLVISNAPTNWLTALFSMEYSGLFRRIVPLLSYFGLPIPLGGTSNHFRKAALEAVGGWDPCNVTEDADLGIRLYRMGYHTGVIKRPTLEHAPENIDIWIKQRTRWLKGWMQTWLVFMRQPFSLFKQNKAIGFLSLQIIIAGMLIAALAHPFAYLFVGHTIIEGTANGTGAITNLDKLLFAIDIFNVLSSYLIFYMNGWGAFIPIEKRDIKKRWLLMVPFYWLLMSWAGWRAVTQLPTQAQRWEKTPHKPIRSKITTNQ